MAKHRKTNWPIKCRPTLAGLAPCELQDEDNANPTVYRWENIAPNLLFPQGWMVYDKNGEAVKNGKYLLTLSIPGLRAKAVATRARNRAIRNQMSQGNLCITRDLSKYRLSPGFSVLMFTLSIIGTVYMLVFLYNKGLPAIQLSPISPAADPTPYLYPAYMLAIVLVAPCLAPGIIALYDYIVTRKHTIGETINLNSYGINVECDKQRSTCPWNDLNTVDRHFRYLGLLFKNQNLKQCILLPTQTLTTLQPVLNCLNPGFTRKLYRQLLIPQTRGVLIGLVITVALFWPIFDKCEQLGIPELKTDILPVTVSIAGIFAVFSISPLFLGNDSIKKFGSSD